MVLVVVDILTIDPVCYSLAYRAYSIGLDTDKLYIYWVIYIDLEMTNSDVRYDAASWFSTVRLC